ncbi:hypothetical protein BC938DRAFT_481561 [Jimgerdemannia flammicorona]|uniref:Uncharacterized protein n=1 Tax=Jimgerdemannia flammicorona TaxID=994334 RepID=A0A433QWY1_9FUNG|nr:hypothetical protein BC938DRAFT_481561 [Jimgerdemannia flammicorona]
MRQVRDSKSRPNSKSLFWFKPVYYMLPRSPRCASTGAVKASRDYGNERLPQPSDRYVRTYLSEPTCLGWESRPCLLELDVSELPSLSWLHQVSTSRWFNTRGPVHVHIVTVDKKMHAMRCKSPCERAWRSKCASSSGDQSIQVGGKTR